MTKVTTPSQLKAELESQKTYLLEACLMAFNQLPNQRTKGAFPSTYARSPVATGKKINLPTTTKPGINRAFLYCTIH